MYILKRKKEGKKGDKKRERKKSKNRKMASVSPMDFS